ncbi:probable myosin-binding protein 5 isoform X1 [Salvia splendens]|uniref:probable myosin-binding protein 5 isoform X1 n=1 Tax=Salvia splendens TaxID=180675 RepID=UPI001C2594BB|nr:probable myosin-binding protein 5 isoform X1 [Salvia splendens]
MLPAGAALRISIEEKFGTLSYFFIYAILEWLVIVLLFFDGLLAFLCNEITQWFELKTPCLLCTRLDHLLVQRSSSFYYNESFCEDHKRNISALAYCHVHKRLSDIRSMCQGCLLSSEKESGCDRRRPLVVDEGNVQLRQLRKYEKEIVANERIGILRCSCCGDPIKLKSPLRYKACLSMAAPCSPRAAWFSGGNGDGGSVDAYTELKLIADSRSEFHGDEYGKEGINNMFGDEPKTPHFSDRNRFFGVALSDGAASASPRTPRRIEFAMEPIKEGETEAELVARLKRQVTLDRRSMMALYMELDEERSASAVAANNAMAMITRLQEEKAAVLMEALQYKRMMEGQAEYDQEAMQRMKDMLVRREEEIKVMGHELEEHGERYSVVGAKGSGDLSEVRLDEDRQDIVNSCGKMSNDPRVVRLDEDHQDIVNSRVCLDEDHQDDIVNSHDEGRDDAREVGHDEDHQDDIVNSRDEGSDDAREVGHDEDHQNDIVNSRDEHEDHQDDIVNSVSEDSDAQCEASHVESHQDIVDSQGEGSDVPCKVGRVNSQVMSPRDEEERKIQDELAALNYEGEMCRILCQLAELEEKLYSADDAELDVLAREVRLVKGRLRAVEAESVLLKHVAMSVQKRGVLSEIAQHLRQLRQ